MIIDFHTHAFPDKIAARTLAALRAGMNEVGHTDIPPCTDGTYPGLVRRMDAAAIDRSVVLPIVTKPSQTETVNRCAAEVNAAGGRLLSFGSVHPADPTAPDTVSRLAAAGFRGIKLHPEFQQVNLDSPECLAVLRSAARSGLCVVTHAGRDVGLPPPVHCTPEMLLRVSDRVPELCLVAAHLGGWMMWDEVARMLAPSTLYFDTAFISRFISPERARDIISAHDPARTLLGSDCPWEDPAESVRFVRSLGLVEERTGAILGSNAEKILLLGKS